MARQAGTVVAAQGEKAWAGRALTEGALTPERLVEFYRLMYLSRRTDDREIVLKRQQKIFFPDLAAPGMRRCWWRRGWR